MSLKKLLRLPQLLVFRLTISYLGVFTVFFILVLITSNLFINSLLKMQLDRIVAGEAEGIPDLIEGMDNAGIDSVLKILSKGSGKVFVRLIYPEGEKFASQILKSADIPVNRTLLKEFDGHTRNVFETISLPQRVRHVRVIYK
jgi:hypothetical protein